MLLPKIFAQKSLSTIIAPHGMTDLMHAREYGITDKLYQVNVGALLTTHFLHVGNFSPMVNAIFVVASVAHFRHDMPVIKDVPRFFFSAAMLPIFAMSPSAFYFYMLCIHVPNHYKMNWKYIQPKLINNIASLLLFTLLFYLGGELFFRFFVNDYMVNIMKGVVVAHIAYEELYIHKNNVLAIEDGEEPRPEEL